ncbi:MAG: nucleotidyltransferase [Clostridia bacterium]|nr:nucleotidyltransferase [Clostridia bacterium]MBQ8371749.1 nucleotidyltransferase [Clostridia bacterium]
MKNPELVIMAAGMGSRYGGLKQIDTVDDQGHIIIDFSIYDAIRAGFRDVTFIIKHEIEKAFREVMDAHLAGKDINVKYVFQEIDKLPEGYSVPDGRKKPWGTAHALMCCLGTVDAPFAVINADDYYGAHAFEKIYDFLKNTNDDGKYHYAMVGYRIKNTVTEQGTVSRGVCAYENGMLTEIVERTKIGIRPDGSIYYTEDGTDFDLDPETLVSMNLWGFTPSYLEECRARFPKFLDENLSKNPEKCEFFLPGVVSDLVTEGKADVRVLDNEDKWYGVTYKEDKEMVVNAFRELKAAGIYPENF